MDEIRQRLQRLIDEATAEGMPALRLSGQLLRPRVAAALLPGTPDAAGDPFWRAVLAVQMAHEASLLHDDIIDTASRRRGRPTTVAAHGFAEAIVQGDHLLTAAYRQAAQTGSLDFVDRFARAVERTVAGELEQGRAIGERMALDDYRNSVLGKSGELLGCSLAVAPTLAGDPGADRIHRVGRRLGLVYQMLDDLLDYCPGTETGKPPLADFRQKRWTWVLDELPSLRFGVDPAEAIALLHEKGDDARSAMDRCVVRFEREAEETLRELRNGVGENAVLESLVREWVARAREAVERESSLRSPTDQTMRAAQAVIRSRVPEKDGMPAFFARNSRSFNFAARLFPAEERARVARVYAFCRMTDDLADTPVGVEGVSREELLDEWLRLSRSAYGGESTGLDFVDRVMGEMAEREVPFSCVTELVEGMRMDLRAERFETLDDLRVYTYRVASVVGLWIAGLAGVRAPAVLERAECLGHAMQLTNIVRDVGEDLRAGRLYLPGEFLARHGIAAADLIAMQEGRRPVSTRYRALLEELMEVAEHDYRRAFTGIPALPASFQRPVAVAAGVYRGIHAEVRRNGYDNLRRRACTSTRTKFILAARSLWELRLARCIHGALQLPGARGAATLERRGSIATGQ